MYILGLDKLAEIFISFSFSYSIDTEMKNIACSKEHNVIKKFLNFIGTKRHLNSSEQL